MSLRTGRTIALDPLAVQTNLKQSLTSPAATSTLTPIVIPANSSSTPHASPSTPAPISSPSSSSSSIGLPSNFNLMTERQQMAYLMRATSEGESQKRTSLMAANKRKQSAADDEDDDENDDDDDDEENEDDEEGEDGSDNEEGNESGESNEEEESADESAEEEEDHRRTSSGKARISTPSSSSATLTTVVSENDHLPRLIRRPLEYALWSSDKQKKWDGINKNPNAFYLHYLGPGIVPRSAAGAAGGAEWSDKERDSFLWSLEAYPPEGMWGLFSMNIPGRTGLECEAFFKRLQKEGHVSATAAKKNQPAAIRVEKSAGKKHLFESTPFLVARPAPTTATAAASKNGASEQASRDKELQTAIANLSLAPMAGTAALKLQVHFRTEANLKINVKEKEKDKEKNKEKSSSKGANAADSTPNAPSTPQTGRKARQSSTGGDLMQPASANKQSGSSAQKPSTPVVSTPLAHAGKRSARNWGSGSGNEPSSGSGSGDKRYSKAASELMNDMMDISTDSVMGSPRAAPSSGSSDDPRALVSSRKRPPTSSSDAASALSSSGGMPALRSEEESNATTAFLNKFKPMMQEHAIDVQIVSQRSEEVPAAAAAASSAAAAASASSSSPLSAVLPFSAFTIPAHSPFVSAKRQKLVATSSLSDAGRIRRAAAPAVQAQPFYREREDVTMELQLDEKGDIRMREVETGRNVRRANAPAAAAAAAASSSSSSSALYLDSSDSFDSEEQFQSYAAELAKLEGSFRTKLRRLSSHQQMQVNRVRAAYGVMGDDDSQCMGYTRVDARSNSANQTHGAFYQPVNTFTVGCRKLLQEYFNKDVEAETIQSILHRCRTYGEAMLEIRLSYKTLLKELQREHQTGRDVLVSLKTAGLLL